MTRDSFKITVAHEMSFSLVQISGPIDETATFPELRSEGHIRVDLSQVTRINSVGTRAWCVWMQRFRAPAEVVLIGCPVCMVSVFRAIKGMLGKQCRVYSFIIPFYSSLTREGTSFVAVWGQHFDHSGKLKIPPVLDSKGNVMEMDVIPETYFSFLKP
jgi:ABC-type transporter Mla MlaB component